MIIKAIPTVKKNDYYATERRLSEIWMKTMQQGFWKIVIPLAFHSTSLRIGTIRTISEIRFCLGTLTELEESLQKQLPKEEVRLLLEPFLALADNRDFWNHALDGLAVLGAKGIFRVYKLHRPVANWL